MHVVSFPPPPPGEETVYPFQCVPMAQNILGELPEARARRLGTGLPSLTLPLSSWTKQEFSQSAMTLSKATDYISKSVQRCTAFSPKPWERQETKHSAWELEREESGYCLPWACARWRPGRLGTQGCAQIPGTRGPRLPAGLQTWRLKGKSSPLLKTLQHEFCHDLHISQAMLSLPRISQISHIHKSTNNNKKQKQNKKTNPRQSGYHSICNYLPTDQHSFCFQILLSSPQWWRHNIVVYKIVHTGAFIFMGLVSQKLSHVICVCVCVRVLIVCFFKTHKTTVGHYVHTPPADLSIYQRTNLMGGIISHCRAQWQHPQKMWS